MKTEDIKTKFSKGNKQEEGQLLSFLPSGNKVKLISKITSKGFGEGTLELFNKMPSTSSLLVENKATASHAICEYEIPLTEEVKKLSLEDKDHVLEEFYENSSLQAVKGMSGSRFLRSRRDNAWALALSDNREVNEEIRAIQACRSNIFTNTIVAVTASVITMSCFALTNRLNREAVLISAFLIFALFIVGALSMVEKARSINIRKGFLAFLAGIMSKNELPDNYKGWGQLKVCYSECGPRRRVAACKRCLSHPTGQKQSCRDQGLENARKLNYAKRSLSGLNDSFMSLCSFVYGFLYLVAIVGFAYSLKPLIDPWWQIPFEWRLLTIVVMIVVTPLIQKSKYATIAIGICFVSALVFSINQDTRYIGIIIMAVTGFFLGTIAWYLVRQMDSVRRGKYSFETFIYVWRNMAKNCEPIPDASQSLHDFRLKKPLARFFADTYHYFLH